jgi:hypothetical protein
MLKDAIEEMALISKMTFFIDLGMHNALISRPGIFHG